MNATEDDMVPILTESILAAYEVPNEPLTPADRCDRCPARAATRFHRPPTVDDPKRRGVLEFCAHHARRYEPELFAGGWQNARPKDGALK